MSKEETPIEKELKEWSPLKFNGEMKWRNEDVIEFTKAKVLEALERELHKIVIEISTGNDDLISHYSGDFRDFKQYYETKVKPNYE